MIDFVPRANQQFCIGKIEGIFLDPGMGKTAVTLAASTPSRTLSIYRDLWFVRDVIYSCAPKMASTCRG